jgi:hypothetical protein
MFIIPNDADGYGVDRCLAKREHCGAAAANSYCQTHSYAEASSFRKVDRDEITGAIPGSDACRGGKCPAPRAPWRATLPLQGRVNQGNARPRENVCRQTTDANSRGDRCKNWRQSF